MVPLRDDESVMRTVAQGQGERKERPATGPVAALDGSAVAIKDGPADGQALPQALPLGGEEFGLVGVGLLVFSTYLLLKKMKEPLVCSTN